MDQMFYDAKLRKSFDSSAIFPIKLIQHVKEHKVLYDNINVCPESVDSAWQEVAKEMNESVATCKEKWRNIKFCFARYLRQKETRKMKKYYLAEYLDFLLPHVKSRMSLYDTTTNYEEDSSDDNRRIKLESPFFNQHNNGFQDNNGNTFVTTSSADVDAIAYKENDTFKRIAIENTNSFQDNRINTFVSTSSTDLEATYKDNELNKRINIENHLSDLDFFRSLLPDLQKMDGRQKNNFKIEVLKIVNNILYSNNNINMGNNMH